MSSGTVGIQEDGKSVVDYFNTFSPVAKAFMVRMVFMLATVHDLELDQINIRAAYLNA
jgi:hypothetical protein